MTAIDKKIPFEAETDASEVAITAILKDAPLTYFQGRYRDPN